MNLVDALETKQFNDGDLIIKQVSHSAGNYMFKVNNRNTRIRCEIFSKLTTFLSLEIGLL